MRILELPAGKSPREWGQIHGEMFRGEVRALADIRAYLCTKVGGFAGRSQVLDAARAHLPVLAAYDQPLYDELCGIAEGAALTPEDIVVANHYTDLRDLDPDPKKWQPAPVDDPGGCSMLWAVSGTGRILAQTWDMHATAIPYVMLISVPASEHGPAAKLLSVTGCLGMAGMNSDRMAIAINNLFSTDATVGVVWPAMVRKALRLKAARSASHLIQTSPIGSGHHYFVADEVCALAIEASGTKRRVINAKYDVSYCHTNHSLDADIAAVSKVPPTSTTYDRMKWLEGDLARAPVTDLADAWRRLGSEEGWPRSVCTNMATPESPHGAATCGAIAMNVTTGELWAQQGLIHNVAPEKFHVDPFFYTWTAQNHAKPLELTGGEGAWFTTRDGGRWLDLGALSYQVNAGHGNRRIVEAIQKQAGELCLSAPNAVFPAKVELANRLLEMAGPGFANGGKVFFTLGGAEANENALKIARLYTKRLKNVARFRSYHGASMGALALTGDWRRAAMEPCLPGVVHVQDCYCDRCPFGQRVETCKRECATNIGDVMALEGGVSAVFLEPVPGANGVLVPPPEYWPLVRAACDREGALLVADEVLCGFGRTGKTFGFQHWDVVPDLITVAKGLASGYATIGAVLVHEKIARYFDDQVLACGLTYYAHPTACAAAVATLDAYRDGAMFANAERLGPVLRRELDAIAAKLAPKTFVRGLGLLAVLEVEAPASAWAALGKELAAKKLSLHVDGKRGTAIFAPPLCITEGELVTGLRAFGEAAVAGFGAK